MQKVATVRHVESPLRPRSMCHIRGRDGKNQTTTANYNRRWRYAGLTESGHYIGFTRNITYEGRLSVHDPIERKSNNNP